jgi:NtrC-family two-component system response regulator AlgB
VPLRLDLPAQAALEAHPWPGNVRELRNVIERMVLLCEKPEAGLDELPESLRQPAAAPLAPDGPLRSLEDVEREQIQRVLAVESNQERAAEILGITTVTLWRKRKLYGLP